MQRVSPAWVLFLLAPALGELLSGSNPPLKFFNPAAFLMLSALYGSGAILVRELTLRWHKGWPSVLVLGAAYGIVEEGLMCKSFFDPQWPDLGRLGIYGRWAGVNWVWSLQFTLYHAVFSIAIPILLVELLFPVRRKAQWVGRRGMLGFALLLLADVIFGFFALTPYRPPAGLGLLAVAGVVALCWLARCQPVHWWTPRNGLPSRPRWFALVGFGGAFAFFDIPHQLPETGVPVPVTLLATVILAMLLSHLVRRLSAEGAWADEHRLALAAGALMFLAVIAPVHEFAEGQTGMTTVGLATMGFLVWLWRRTRLPLGRATAPAVTQFASIKETK